MTDSTTSPPTSAPARTAGRLSHPQAVGVWPLPAGYLLIADGPDHDEARAALAAGRRPTQWPSGLEYYRSALDGDVATALALLDEDDADVVTLVNRLVLDPSAELLATVRSLASGAVAAHAETVAFAVGLSSSPPDPGLVRLAGAPVADDASTPGGSSSGAAATDGGEIAALAWAAHATAALERHDRHQAIESLEQAAQAARPVSAALAGQLLGQLANAQLDDGGAKRAAVTFQAALDLLEDTDLTVSRAELHVGCGALHQEMSEAAPRLMKIAIGHYLAALRLVSAESAPEVFAIANANLGLAYLTTPMSDASDLLRIGIAVQSMRDALTVFSPDNHPDRWSSTQLNLANALVYMPSTHQADNIGEAVELYEQVLAVRDRGANPEGRARVLANQGNALAHLGMFDLAKGRLHEARAIFEEFEDHDAVRSVRSVLDEVARAESVIRQDAPTNGSTS